MPTLADGFSLYARENPAQAAFVLGDAVVSYADLASQAERWRVHLAHQAGQRSQAPAQQSVYVAWCGSNHPTLPALYLANVMSGYCLILLDPTWPDTTTSSVLQRFSPLSVITPECDCRANVSAELISQLPVGTPDAFFLLGFTSGSTGMPKAFIRRQQSWLSTFAHAANEFPALPRVLAPGPLSHGLSFYAMAETLHRGGTCYCLERFDAATARQRLVNDAIDTLVVVPTMLSAILQQCKTAGTDNGAVKLILSAGAKLSESLQQQARQVWPGVVLSEYYGASELSFVSVAHCRESAPPESVGRAFHGVEIIIRNAAGRALGPGRQGVVYVRSDMVAEGYLQPDGEVQSLTQAGDSYTVGDVGRLDEQGNLYLLDRLDNMIISGGLNIYPAEVETVLDSHPLIQESRVTSTPDQYWGERLCAFLRLQPGVLISIEELKSFCRQRLSAHQVPRKIMTIEQWPVTSSGKMDAQSLRAMASSDAQTESLSKYSVVSVLDE